MVHNTGTISSFGNAYTVSPQQIVILHLGIIWFSIVIFLDVKYINETKRETNFDQQQFQDLYLIQNPTELFIPNIKCWILWTRSSILNAMHTGLNNHNQNIPKLGNNLATSRSIIEPNIHVLKFVELRALFPNTYMFTNLIKPQRTF